MKKSRHHLPTDHRDRIVDLLSAHVLKNHPEIAAAYIFGSFATAGPFADIDVALLLGDLPTDPLGYEFALESDFERIAGFPVDVRILNPAPLSFQYQVIRRGRIIADRDPTFRADFMSLALKKYFDFAPFRRRYLQEVSNAPI